MPQFITYEYDPASIDTAVGTEDVSGYADGEFIKAARNEDAAKLYVGADGDNTVTHVNNRSGRVTITLQQGSPLNDYFSQIADLWEQKQPGGVVPILSTDSNGTTKISAKQAWIVKRADSPFGKEVGNREWVFETGNLILNTAGARVLGS